MAIVCNPVEQKRFTVTPDVVTGRPARIALWRAMLAPVAPSGLAAPRIQIGRAGCWGRGWRAGYYETNLVYKGGGTRWWSLHSFR